MNLIPLVSIGVKREGKNIFPELNKPFDFTKEEREDLDKLTGKTGHDYYRLPVNETSAVAVTVAAEVPAASETQVAAEVPAASETQVAAEVPAASETQVAAKAGRGKKAAAETKPAGSDAEL